MSKFNEIKDDDDFGIGSNKKTSLLNSSFVKLIIGVVIILIVILGIFIVYSSQHKKPSVEKPPVESPSPTPSPSSSSSSYNPNTGSGSVFDYPSPTQKPSSSPKQEVKTEEITKKEATDLVIESNISISNRKKINDLLVKHKNLKEITNQELLYFAYQMTGYDVINGPATIAQRELDIALRKTPLAHKSLISEDIVAYDQVEYYYADAELYTKNVNYIPNDASAFGTRMFCLTADYNHEAAGYVLKAYCVYNSYGVGGAAAEYYSTYEDTKNEEIEPLFKNKIPQEQNKGLDYAKYNPVSVMKKNFSSLKDKMSTVSYTFVKRNGKIYLTNYKVTSPKK